MKRNNEVVGVFTYLLNRLTYNMYYRLDSINNVQELGLIDLVCVERVRRRAV